MENLQNGFVRVKNLRGNQHFMQSVIQWLQNVRARENPVRHDLTGEKQPLPFPILLLTVQRNAQQELLRHDMRHGFGRSESARNERRLLRRGTPPR